MMTDQGIAIARSFARRQPSRRLVVLNYHAVKDTEKARFGEQMEALCRLAKPVGVDALEAANGPLRRVLVTFDDGFQCLVRNAFPEMEPRKIPCVIFVPVGSLGKKPTWAIGDNHPYAEEVVFTREQIGSITHKPGVYLGAHGVTHGPLTAMGPQEALTELADSKLILESVTGTNVDMFSFPYGAFDDTHVKLAAKIGFRYIFSILPTLRRSHCLNTVLIGRVRVDPSDWPIEFRLKVFGAYRWLPLAFKIKRRLYNMI